MRRLLIPFSLLLSACATVTPPPAGALVWADEFDGNTLNLDHWDYDTHRNRDGWYNDEAQYYGPQNVSVADGTLRITARREDLSQRADWGGQSYSSARIRTKGRKPVHYSRVEARIKLPCGRGLWPAFWMLPEADSAWPDGGEIDIMEFVGHDPNRFHATVHTLAANHMNGTEVGEKIRATDACGVWHIHRLDWSADRITVSLDGEPYFTYSDDGRGADSWPFDKPFHILLNMAVGGSWGGQRGIDETVFPAVMEVDYVRVYAPG